MEKFSSSFSHLPSNLNHMHDRRAIASAINRYTCAKPPYTNNSVPVIWITVDEWPSMCQKQTAVGNVEKCAIRSFSSVAALFRTRHDEDSGRLSDKRRMSTLLR